MPTDYSRIWDWFDDDQKRTLRGNPRGPIPGAVLDRVMQIGPLQIGMRRVGEDYFLPAEFAAFIEGNRS